MTASNSELIRDSFTCGRAHRIHHLPGHEHGHDRGLASSGRHFEGKPEQFRIGLLVCALNMRPIMLVLLLVSRNFRQPDDRLDRFDLTEKGADALKVMMPPVMQKARGRGCHALVVLARQCAPSRDTGANFIDDRGRVVFLTLRCSIVTGREAQADPTHIYVGYDLRLKALEPGAGMPCCA